MRAAVRPLAFFVALCGFTATAQSQSEDRIVSVSDLNYLGWGKGSPTPTTGGVDVVVNYQPTMGYTCTKVVIRVIDNATGKTLDTFTSEPPTARIVTNSFTGLGSNKMIQVTAEAVFQNGEVYDTQQIEAVVTTQ
jgi:hypothetical protein